MSCITDNMKKIYTFANFYLDLVFKNRKRYHGKNRYEIKKGAQRKA